MTAAGTTVTQAPALPSFASSPPAGAPAPSASPPAADDGPQTQACIPIVPFAYDRGVLDDDTACPGSSTTLRMGGLTPGRRFEVWQAEDVLGQPCTWHPRDAGGVRLGEVTAGTNGRITFPFQVADVPEGRSMAGLALWLMPSDGGPFLRPVTWSCIKRNRLSGRLYGEDGQPYLRPVTVTARFTSHHGLLAERTATTSSGQYVFEDVPVPAQTNVRVYDDGWLLADASVNPVQQWRGRPDEDGQPWARPYGSEVALDIGGPAADPARSMSGEPIPLWYAPFSLPRPVVVAPSAPPDPSPRVACKALWPAVLPHGDVDDELAYKGGDELTLRVRQVPPNLTFDVWQTESIAGHKDVCPPWPASFDGVKIGSATSDDQGRLVQRLRLADIERYHPSKELLLWLVWPDGKTTDAVVRWDTLVPSSVSGRLYDENGKLYTGSVRVELYVHTAKRVLHLTTNASGGRYRFADVPAPADLELVVYQGDRRLARRQVSHYHLPPLQPLSNHLLPAQGTPIALDFGGPGDTADPTASDFPLLVGP